jgi:serine protease Do
MATILSQLAAETRALADRVGGGVVAVEGGWRPSSGVIAADGLVLTNAHNVHDEAVSITFADGRVAEGTVAGVDGDGDLAVIRVDTTGASAMPWGPDAGPSVGDAVFAVAAGLRGSRVTLGFVSGLAREFRGPRGRRIRGSIEHTAPMAPGSSGSALVDVEGRLVGLNTNRIGGGFYLAIPTDTPLQARVTALGRGESPERPRLGVGLAPSGAARRMRQAVGLPERDGLLVREVVADSPAAKGGIETGDLLVSAAGKPLADADDLSDALAAAGAGGELELRVVRGVDERVVRVTLDAA